MRAEELEELAARIMAPMRTMDGEVFFEIVPPALELLARRKPNAEESAG
jgi:hypothetical protein